MYYFFSYVLLLFYVLSFFLYPVRGLRRSENLRVYSEEKILLSEKSQESGFSDWQKLEDIPESLREILLWSEDKRFYYHPGFDPFAMVRSVWQLIIRDKASGASTITQQLVRILFKDKLYENRFLRKIEELFLALRLELTHSKNSILESYVNQVPMPDFRFGLAAASRHYFQKNLSTLNLAEFLSLLVFLRYGPLDQTTFRRAYKRLIFRLEKDSPSILNSQLRSSLASEDMQRSLNQKIFSSLGQGSFSQDNLSMENSDSSPLHLSHWISNRFPKLQGDVYTTLKASLNRQVLAILKNELQYLRGQNVSNGAVVVLEKAQKGEDNRLYLRALVGSRDFFEDNIGQVNGAFARRSAGSTLKPFLYALAFAEYGKDPYDIIQDEESSFYLQNREYFTPRNYDLDFWGDMTLHEALANSRNIPALKLLEEIGPQNFANKLQELNLFSKTATASDYGPGLALGISGVSLFRLAHAYSVFLNEGWIRPVLLAHQGETWISIGEKKKIYDKKTTERINFILSDREIRRSAFGRRNFLDFPFEVAAKTGSSKDNVDSWTIGYSPRYVVAVWLGNFSGESMQDVSGIWGAGRVFHQVMRLLHPENNSRFAYGSHWQKLNLCKKTGLPADSKCLSIVALVERTGKNGNGQKIIGKISNDNRLRLRSSKSRINIYSPKAGAVYRFSPAIKSNNQAIPLHIEIYPRDFDAQYRLNQGKWIKFASTIKSSLILQPGEYQLTVRSQKNNTEESIVFLVDSAY